MSAATVATRGAVKAAIGAASLSQSGFTLDDSYAEWDLKLEEIDRLEIPEQEKLRVDVVSHTTLQTVELAARGAARLGMPIDVAIRKKFGDDDTDPTSGRIIVGKIDELVKFTEEIFVELLKFRLASPPESVWVSTEIPANPVREHLRDIKQFTGIIRVNFQAVLTIPAA